MAIPTIPKSLYPLVPKALGVPALLRSGAQLLDTLTLGYLGIGKALGSLIGSEPVTWGVFDQDGRTIAPYDSVFAVGYQNESRLSDYPIEQGSFATFNKVAIPFDVVVTLTCGGSDAHRAEFLASLEIARAGLRSYIVLTPDRTYRNVNFTGLNMQRSAREGATLLTVQLLGREVREVSGAIYSQPTIAQQEATSGIPAATIGTPKNVAAYATKDQGLIQTVRNTALDSVRIV